MWCSPDRHCQPSRSRAQLRVRPPPLRVSFLRRDELRIDTGGTTQGMLLERQSFNAGSPTPHAGGYAFDARRLLRSFDVELDPVSYELRWTYLAGDARPATMGVAYREFVVSIGATARAARAAREAAEIDSPGSDHDARIVRCWCGTVSIEDDHVETYPRGRRDVVVGDDGGPAQLILRAYWRSPSLPSRSGITGSAPIGDRSLRSERTESCRRFGTCAASSSG